jgi:carboxypeptidase family protein
VSGPPVKPAAGRTPAKASLGAKDVGRHLSLHAPLRHRERRPVALETAPAEAGSEEGGPIPEEQLAELLVQERAADQESAPGRPALDQAGVAGEQDPTFPDRERHQIGVLDPAEVDDVVAQNPEPAGQTSEHAIGGETERLGFDSSGSLCYFRLPMFSRVSARSIVARLASRAILGATLGALLAFPGPPAEAALRGKIRGTVRDLKGKPVPGLLVRLTSPIRGLVHVTDTDEKGIYAFADLEAGDYEIDVSGSGYQRQVKQGITVQPPFRNIVDFTLPPGPMTLTESPEPVVYPAPRQEETVRRPVTGSFFDKSRHPIPDVLLVLINPAASVIYRAQSDREGKVTIPEVPTGTYRAVVLAPGYVSVDLKQVEVSQEKGLELSLSLVDYPLRFDGRLEDLIPDEKPIPPVRSPSAP